MSVFYVGFDIAMEIYQDNNSRVSKTDNILLSKAREEFGETDELREECILMIQEWMQTKTITYPLGIWLISYESPTNNDTILLQISMWIFYYKDEISIVWFLRGCKYDINRTKTRIENFFSFRSQVKEWYSDRDPLKPELDSLLDIG